LFHGITAFIRNNVRLFIKLFDTKKEGVPVRRLGSYFCDQELSSAEFFRMKPTLYHISYLKTREKGIVFLLPLFARKIYAIIERLNIDFLRFAVCFSSVPCFFFSIYLFC
jgi:hypothetical protein